VPGERFQVALKLHGGGAASAPCAPPALSVPGHAPPRCKGVGGKAGAMRSRLAPAFSHDPERTLLLTLVRGRDDLAYHLGYPSVVMPSKKAVALVAPTAVQGIDPRLVDERLVRGLLPRSRKRERWYYASDVARAFGLHSRTVQRWILSGRLAARRMGSRHSRWRVSGRAVCAAFVRAVVDSDGWLTRVFFVALR